MGFNQNRRQGKMDSHRQGQVFAKVICVGIVKIFILQKNEKIHYLTAQMTQSPLIDQWPILKINASPLK